MTITTPRRLGLLAVTALFAAAACSSTGASSAPSSAASEQPSAAPASAVASAVASAPAMTLPEPAAANTTLQGAGATFPTPLYNVWFETYTAKYPNVQFDYQSIGSGGGIKAITEQTVDFGASDAAMKDEEIAALPAGHEDPPRPDRARRRRRHLQPARASTSSSSTPRTSPTSSSATITKWNDPKIARQQRRRDPAGHCRSSSSIARTARARRTPSRPTSTRSAPTGTRKVGEGKEVKWPIGSGRPGQRRRRRRGQADPGRGRLRRAPVRDPGEDRLGA